MFCTIIFNFKCNWGLIFFTRPTDNLASEETRHFLHQPENAFPRDNTYGTDYEKNTHVPWLKQFTQIIVGLLGSSVPCSLPLYGGS